MKISRSVWTTEEDDLILDMLSSGKTYADISRKLGDKSSLQIRNHHTVILQRKLKTGRSAKFDIQDDWQLIRLVAGKGRAWKDISKQDFLNLKTPSQLQMRWRTLSPLVFAAKDMSSLNDRLKILHTMNNRTAGFALRRTEEEKLEAIFEKEYCGSSTPSLDEKKSPAFALDIKAAYGSKSYPELAMMEAEAHQRKRPNINQFLRESHPCSNTPSTVKETMLYQPSKQALCANTSALASTYVDASANIDRVALEEMHSAWRCSRETSGRCALFAFGIIGSLSRIHDHMIVSLRTSLRAFLGQLMRIPRFELGQRFGPHACFG